MSKDRKGGGVVVNREGLADVMGVSNTTVSAWAKRGCPYLQQGGAGREWQFNTAHVIEWRLNEMAGKLGDGAKDYDEGQARKMQADADLAEIKRDKERGKLIELQVVADVVRGEYATVRTRLGSLPGILAPRLDSSRALEFQPVIAEVVDDILTELSADDRLQDDADSQRADDAAGGSPGDPEAGSAPEPD
jgi:phage terminase Nu1 subunit (DNA packaging protein)